LRLADIFATHWESYRQANRMRLTTAHHRAAEAILRCRTPALGGHVYRCADCGGEHHAWHSCNHRSCPRCGATDQAAWAAAREANAPPCDHWLITFTVPPRLHWLFLCYPKEIYQLLFDAVAATLHELGADEKFLGGEVGFIAVLHTWTRQLLFHPHLHVLMPGIALRADHRALVRPKRCNGAYLFPGNIAAAVFRNRFEMLLKERHPAWHRKIIKRSWRGKWIADVKNAGRGQEAIRYLAAYVAKSALTDKRILGADGAGRILVRWFDRQDNNKPKVLRLHPHELIRRVMLHVLPKGQKRLRHFGFLSPAAKKRMKLVRDLLRAGPAGEPRAIPEWERTCEHCGGKRLMRVARIAKPRGPPFEAREPAP